MPRITNGIALLTLGILVLSAPAFADPEKVGVAAEVNPDVTGQPPNEPLRELLIGHNIIRNEKITTQDAGQAQLLFTDQSTLTVARNSEVVIDEFVFDPKKQVGDLTAAFTSGLFRYVGGKISKEKDVTFYTPTGSVSVRGGIALIKVHGNSLQAIFVFGERMTVTINGETETATQPNTVIFTTDGRPSAPAPASVEMLELLNRELQSSSNQTLTIGNEFAAEIPDLPPEELLRTFIPRLTEADMISPTFTPTQTQGPNPTIPTPTLVTTPAIAPSPALTPTSPIATTPTQTSNPTPPPASTSTPPPASHDHHWVHRDHHHHHDHDGDRDFGDRHDHNDHFAERDPDDRFHRWTEPTAADWEHRDRRDDSGDRHDRWSGQDPDHGNDKNLEGHSSFDRYVISDDDNRDHHSGENHGFERHPGADGHTISWNEPDGDPSHRFGHEDRHRRAHELLAFDHFRDAIGSSWGRHIPYWASGGRRDEPNHAGRHHISAHR